MKIIEFLFFPEKSNLTFALWAARFFLLLAWIQIFRISYLLIITGIQVFRPESLADALMGGPMFKETQEAFGISLLLLIGSHLLVVLVVHFRNKDFGSASA